MRVVGAHVPERRFPERHHVNGRRRGHRRLHDLERGRFGLESESAGRGGDAPSELDVAHAEIPDVAGHELHDDTRTPQVDIGLVVQLLVQLGDRRDEPCTRGERARPEVRVRSPIHDAPVVDSGGVVELLRSDRLDVHPPMVATKRRRRQGGDVRQNRSTC